MSLSLDKLKIIIDIGVYIGGIEQYDGLSQTFELPNSPNTTLFFKANECVFQRQFRNPRIELNETRCRFA